MAKFAEAKDLSETALFLRCYSQLTQTFPNKDLPLMQEVRAGTKTALTACLSVLNSVSFNANGNTTLSDPNDQTALNVVKVFHGLHYSWFSTKFFPEIGDLYVSSAGNIYDRSTPALYITRSLFVPGAQFSEIFTGDNTYRSKRQTDEYQSSRVWGIHAPADDTLQGVKFAGLGSLIGVEPMQKNLIHDTLFWNKPSSDTSLPLPQRIPGPPIAINTHWGGGVLGSQIYMLQNIQGTDFGDKTDGGIKSNRKWSRSVFKDFLCRDLPAIRELDAASYVQTGSSLSYRTSKGCVKCHASIDTMAGLVRDTHYDTRAYSFELNGMYAFLVKRAKTKNFASYFPTEPDSDFYQRPTTGSFYFRTYDGQLVFKEVSSLDDLTTEILKLDDLYVCAAKRYFEYFTGINVDISDIKDPAHPSFPALSTQQHEYRDLVVSLGKSLKQDQSIKKLIENIMKTSVYKSEDFSLSK